MAYLFSYGTLRNRDVQIAVFGREVSAAPDALPDHALRTVTLTNWKSAGISGGDTQKTAEPCAGESVEGAVLDVSEQDLQSCDAYEPAEYKRIRVRLRSGVSAWLYVKA